LPGIEIAAEVNGHAKNNNRTNVQGQLVLKGFFFITICMRTNDIKKCFIGDWYLSGDLAKKKDADGYFWFIGRADEDKNTSRKRL
jgi:acetyl-CoA synthetase